MSPKPDPRTAGRLFVLDLSGGRVLSMKTDGSDETVIAAGCHLPDGIAIDTRAGHVYWTNMGVPSREDGSIEVGALDRAILAAGYTHVRPVHVAGPGVDGDAVGQVAACGDDRLVGAVRLHRKDAASAEVENEQTAGSAGIWFRTHDRLLAGFRAFLRNGAAHA